MPNRTNPGRPLVTTSKEKCKVCYTCVRECPAKAIRIYGGQAEVIEDRCIGCGICVKVCSQNAKQVRNCVPEVKKLLLSEKMTIACIAPSFPAEFEDIRPGILVGLLRAMGFDKVVEVAFGADLVSRKYSELIRESDGTGDRYIATTCPAIVSYVQKYHPSLVKNLAPIVSPMVAIARILKHYYSEDYRIVFIGPCIAKKDEGAALEDRGEIDIAITYSELRELLEDSGISAASVTESSFDPPHPGKGTLFAIERGLLESADLKEDLMTNEIVATDGAKKFVHAIREFEKGGLNARLLEVLCCNGCIMGSGMTSDSTHFARRAAVGRYAKNRVESLDRGNWRSEIDRYEYIDLSREFRTDDHRLPAPSKDELKRILAAMGKFNPQDELNCGACGYDTCMDHAIAIHKGLAENEMCLPFSIETLKETAKELSASYEQLVNAKNALIQAEKLAGMGQLAAGIAHEVNNPLGVVLLYANLMYEECEDDDPRKGDLKVIVEQGDRAKKIVGGLLNFSRKNKLNLQPTELTRLITRSLKGIVIPDGVEIVTHHEVENNLAAMDPDQIIQAILNLVTNAIEAMPDGGRIVITSGRHEEDVFIHVRDNGSGISEKNLTKIFEPFFTTKQIGKGTGLGLAVTYGIIKMHQGHISVQSNNNPEKGETFTEFRISLPIRKNGSVNGIIMGGENEKAEENTFGR